MTATWRACAAVAVATLALVASVVRAQVPDPLPEPPYTPVHQAGYCVWYEECGESDDPRIPGKLNCVYNGPARNLSEFENEEQFRTELVDFCGPKWAEDVMPATCCSYSQLQTLVASLTEVRQFVASCPACWNNFRELFCQTTCSPDASLFMDVTEVIRDPSSPPGTGLPVIEQVSVYIDPYFSDPFYNSCANVTFSQSNVPAMLFVGGGATNAQDFLNFLGRKQFLGSPFNITFVEPRFFAPPFVPMRSTARNCNDTDVESRCTCVDCFQSCPEPLPMVAEAEICYVGGMRCLSFTLIILFASAFTVIVGTLLCLRRKAEELPSMSESVGLINEDAVKLPKDWFIYSWLQKNYYHWGLWVARHPGTIMFLTLLFVGGFSAGLIKFQVETDPVALWSAETSTTRLQKNYFDETFGPFYRTQQVILSTKDGSSIVSYQNLKTLFEIQGNVTSLTVRNGSVDFYSLCFRPLDVANTVSDCVIQSVAGYWQNSFETLEFNYCNADRLGRCTNDETQVIDHYEDCTSNPAGTGTPAMPDGCLPPFQDPIRPEVVIGGFDDDDQLGYLDATAFVVTFLINNSLNETYLDLAYEWEEAMVAYMQEAVLEHEELRITFYTESGVELELARESASDLITVAISYIVMLLYVSIALGRFSSVRRLFIDTKFTLGIAGVFICICSVLVSVGIFSLAGVKTSLIIAEVIPFLVLAVGVDNIFILVNQFERFEKTIAIDERIAQTMSEVGPSITLSAVAETVAFALGAIVSMPAVNSFAAYSAVAIFVDFLLQITCFVTLLGLDARRAEARRMDCLPCIPINTSAPPAAANDRGFLQRFVIKYYAPALLHPITKPIVMVFFCLLLITGISLTPYLQLGLDQSEALPQDSYLIPYFVDQASLLKVGSPVYFVIQGGNVSTVVDQAKMCATFQNCSEYSSPNIIVQESSRPDYSTVALRPSLWLDDFVNWLSPENDRCCRINNYTNEYCQATDTSANCTLCYTQEEYDALTIAPTGPEFMDRLRFWLQAVPGELCVRAGAGAYADAILPNYETNTVEAAHFRTYHTVIQTQAEYINAYVAALRVCDLVMEQNSGISCFPYTIFYVYFEMYLNIIAVMVFVLALASVAVFLVTWIVLGSAGGAAIVVGVVLMIIVDMVGVMAVWQISLNAVSLVNLVMALGISVEFCSHMTRAFTVSSGTRQSRAQFALVDVGASVFSGITVTKFAGVIVLAFAQSEIFVIYYFRMYLSTVILGFLHGLVFLPVLLTYIGPNATGGKSADESMEQLAQGFDKEERKLEQRRSIYGTAD